MKIPTPPAFAAVLSAGPFAIGIRCDADELLGLEYLRPGHERRPTNPVAIEAVRQLRAWLADPRFEFALPLAAAGTPFQRRVRTVIATIPCGETRSYGEIARAVHSAPRAVGGACGANPYPLVIPCHRVVAADGRLGGFGGFDASDRDAGSFHLAVKRWLLAHEHARVR